MYKKVYFHILFLQCFIFFQSNAQNLPWSLGAGLNSSFNFSNYDNIFPSTPITPYLTIKVKKSEFIIGADLFPDLKKITGIQGGYRYHFYRGDKHLHLFIDCNLEYLTYINDNGETFPYNAKSIPFMWDGSTPFKVQSLVNNYGLGIELNFLKRITFYTIIGAGFNYRQSEYTVGNWPDGHIVNKLYFLGYCRAGLSFTLYQGK
jgi:hypothetical protein